LAISTSLSPANSAFPAAPGVCRRAGADIYRHFNSFRAIHSFNEQNGAAIQDTERNRALKLLDNFFHHLEHFFVLAAGDKATPHIKRIATDLVPFRLQIPFNKTVLLHGNEYSESSNFVET
jgi:hypothetical protein